MTAEDPTHDDRAGSLASTARELLADAARRHVETARALQDHLSRLDAEGHALGIEYRAHPTLSKALQALATEIDVLLGSVARITDLPPQHLTRDWPTQPTLTSTFSLKEPVLHVTLPPRPDLAVRLSRLDTDRPDRVAHLHPLLRDAYAGRTLTAQAVIRAYTKALRTYARSRGLDAGRYHQATTRLRQDFPRYLHALVDEPLARDLVLAAWYESPAPATEP